MSILINENTKLIIQGITGRDGSFHTKQMLEYGTDVVAGVNPGKEGKRINSVPVFNTLKKAVSETKANATIIFVPVLYAIDAIYEAVDNDIELIICITEGIPVYDLLKVKKYIDGKKGLKLIGPNCPGIISPGKAKVGIMPGNIHKKGNVGVVSRSGTLTYEIVQNLTTNEIGQSTAIGIGGDPIIGTDFIDIISMFNEDDDTDYIVMIGEIGGNMEEKTAEYIKKYVNKPVFSFIAGKSSPKDKRMGHAGAIISGNTGKWENKVKSLKEAGVNILDTPSQISEEIKHLELNN